MRNEINPRCTGSGLTVIIAEQYPISRAALAALLSYDGYRVFQAANARSAISHLSAISDVKVLLADLDMPEWRSIVQHATETTDALVIGLEGNVPFRKMYNLQEYGIRFCLQKPLRYQDVLAAIEGNAYPAGEYRKAA